MRTTPQLRERRDHRPLPEVGALLRVVVVDDNETVRSAMAAALSIDPAVGFVGVAADAGEAVSAAEQVCADVVLMDVRIPGGGAEATAKLLRRRPSVRVVACSGHHDRDSVTTMLRAGACGYVVKGGPVSEITAAVKKAAAGGTHFSPLAHDEVAAELVERYSIESAQTRHRHDVERRVRRALAGGIHPVFQPIVDLRSAAPIGWEALARFSDPAAAGPLQMFADAKSVGLGVELELAAVRAALSAGWSRSPGTFLSVNLSPDAACAPALADVLGTGSLRGIVIEVTEHDPVQCYSTLREALMPLRFRGLRVAVDDAGAGYASFRHILDLAPDFIKLDISITQKVTESLADRAMCAALIRFAVETDAAVVAEGIETSEQRHALLELGAAYGQGYAFGRPGLLSTGLQG